MKIRKAVFPVAGLGTRFLPSTKASPKEMLPIVDKPLIQYAVNEAIAAGINELIFVTNLSKRAIEDHFDSNFELETKLLMAEKMDMLQKVKDILPKNIFCTYVRQQDQLGLGHAILCAKAVVGNEPFAVILADDLIGDEHGYCLKKMVDIYEETRCSILALKNINKSDVDKYGIVDIAENNLELGCHIKLHGIVEKPNTDAAPSLLASVGRYILNPRIFDFLEKTAPGKNGEIQLTDGLCKLMLIEDIYGYLFKSTHFDCGNKLGYLKAVVHHAINHQDFGEDFEKFLKEFCKELT